MSPITSALAAGKPPSPQNQGLLQQRIDDLSRGTDFGRTLFSQPSAYAIVVLDFDGNIIAFNEGAQRAFGYRPEEVVGRRTIDLLFPPEFIAAGQMQAAVGAALGEQQFAYDGDMLRNGGQRFPVQANLVVTKDGSGQIVGFILLAQDISARKQAEQQLQASLAEKEVLMREIHHRVKNNLQMMSALLELQSGYVKDGSVRVFLTDSQRRIRSMALVHEQLYRNGDYSNIDFAAYLRELVANLGHQFGELGRQVRLRIDAPACTLPVDIAIPCGLVLSELVSNVFKHAFPAGRAGELRIGLHCGAAGRVRLAVADDGVGLPAGLDIHRSNSFGLKLITLMVEQQLHGKLSIESTHPGTRVLCDIGASP